MWKDTLQTKIRKIYYNLKIKNLFEINKVKIKKVDKNGDSSNNKS